MRGHAFISYVREDGQVVDRLQGALEAAGIPVWRDTTDIDLGEDWRTEIRRAIADARVFIVCFSERSLTREKSLLSEELAWAVEQYRRRPRDTPWLIPVRLTDSPLPRIDLGEGRTLESLNWLNLFGDLWDDGIARLVGDIRRLPAVEDPDQSGLPEGNQAALTDANVGIPTTVGSQEAPQNVPVGGMTDSDGRYLAGGSPTKPQETPRNGRPSRPNVEFLPVNLPPGLQARFRVVTELSPSNDDANAFVVDDLESGERRVLKLYRPGVMLSSDFAATLQALSQDDEAAQHLVALYEFGAEGGLWYEVQEHCPSGSLRKALAAGRRIDPVELAGEVASALEYLEGRRLFHGDLRPESFQVRSLEPLDVVVGDFGLARDSGSGSVQWTVQGTSAYQPPEAAQNRVTKAWDWWSAGMVIAEVALGRHPLTGPEGTMPPLLQIVDRINQQPVDLSGIADEHLRNLCRGLLFPDPDRRWRSQEVAAWLVGEEPNVPWDEPAGEVDRPGQNDALHERRSVRDERASIDRVVEVVAYLGTNDPDRADAIIDRIDDLFLAAGGVELTITSVERGSFFVKLRGLLARDVAQHEFRDRLAKLERGVELRLLDGHEADVTDKTAKAFAAVKAELADVEVACIRIKALLVLKYPNADRSVLLVRTLSHLEVRALERFPELQQHPEHLLEALSTVVAMEDPSTEGLRPTASDD